jgi:uncharacterized integral membrane protein
MDWKLIIFFIVAILTLTYFVTFWQNKDERTHLHIFGQKIDINLGLLMFGVFLDGAILAVILIWLLV